MNTFRRGSSEICRLYTRVCIHVAEPGLAGASDGAIWQHARDHRLAIVTKNEDFHRLCVLHDAPPKVIWLRLGNCSTTDIVRLLNERRGENPPLSAERGCRLSRARLGISARPVVAIALGRIALDIACAALATRVPRGVTRVSSGVRLRLAPLTPERLKPKLA